MNIKDSLGLNPSFKNNEIDLGIEESIDMAIAKYKRHSSINTIKRQVMINRKFEFSNVDLLNIMNKIEA